MHISVVIPAYNEEKYLPQCLEALRHQSYPRSRYEVIVVDNASTDSTAAIARSFDVRVVPEPKKSVAQARQTGARAAQGSIIAGTDADAIPPTDWLTTIAELFTPNHGLGGVTGPVYLYDGTGLERWYTRYINNGVVRLTHVIGKGCFSGNNFAVQVEPFWQVGGFNTGIQGAEDADLSVRLGKVTRVDFAPRLTMSISSRRAREGYWKVISRAGINYMRVLWLGIPPTDQTDIR
jgi:glycosyltransferase involved in cell wall biosynthesis